LRPQRSSFCFRKDIEQELVIAWNDRMASSRGYRSAVPLLPNPAHPDAVMNELFRKTTARHVAVPKFGMRNRRPMELLKFRPRTVMTEVPNGSHSAVEG
jgi:hypothetical protein